MDEVFEIIKAGPGDTPPEQALYRIQQTYPDGSGGRLNIDWDGLLQVHGLIHDRIALEGYVCETCDTKGCHRPATWESSAEGSGYPAASSTRVTSIALIRRSYPRRTRSADW
jgi:hypothetical protein